MLAPFQAGNFSKDHLRMNGFVVRTGQLRPTNRLPTHVGSLYLRPVEDPSVSVIPFRHKPPYGHAGSFPPRRRQPVPKPVCRLRGLHYLDSRVSASRHFRPVGGEGVVYVPVPALHHVGADSLVPAVQTSAPGVGKVSEILQGTTPAAVRISHRHHAPFRPLQLRVSLRTESLYALNARLFPT